ncbi:hypothetical protein Glove_180g74 [Diversispora epigaea]|uniref:Protein kinase domain-containing protein n=1 Tax=Diversispora epigaea TaxID=1348612 RepID=A0A397IWD9_9GLOM|nr:hypothetical protein Glove_180g74 [Diversispora epigaea]
MSDKEFENIVDIGNIENIFDIENTKDIESTKIIENTKNIECTKNVENIENIAKKSKKKTTDSFSSTKKSKKKTTDSFSSTKKTKKKTTDSFSSNDGTCPECLQPQTGNKWCNPCNSKHFQDEFPDWTSENKEIDKFIQETQLNALGRSSFIEWVDYKKFFNVQYLARGGFGTVYKANWLKGPIVEWNMKTQTWTREIVGSDKYTVALKSLNNSVNITKEFLDEVKTCLYCSGNYLIVRCLGITKHSETGNYMMIMDYGYGGNLRKYLGQNFTLFDWYKKLSLARDIAEGLRFIHKRGCVHRDFHSGNIVYNGSWPCITDLGLCRPADKQLDTDEIYGVLPYLGPEVIRGQTYTSASDVYSLGVIMWEISCAELPFGNRSHDINLVIDICKGERPKFKDNVPKCYVELVNRCWESDPKDRPEADEVLETLEKWFVEFRDSYNSNSKLSEIVKQFREADKIDDEKVKTKEIEQEIENNMIPELSAHPSAVYTSRVFKLSEFSNNSFSKKNYEVTSREINFDAFILPSDLE